MADSCSTGSSVIGRCLLSALHPDRTAQGQRARFIDPRTGVRRHILTIHRTIEEYLAIAAASGTRLKNRATASLNVMKWRFYTKGGPSSLGSRTPRKSRRWGSPRYSKSERGGEKSVPARSSPDFPARRRMQINGPIFSK